MDTYRIGKVDKKSINESLLAMNRAFAKQRAQNASSYVSMSNMLNILVSNLTAINSLISQYAYWNEYMKSLISSL